VTSLTAASNQVRRLNQLRDVNSLKFETITNRVTDKCFFITLFFPPVLDFTELNYESDEPKEFDTDGEYEIL